VEQFKVLRHDWAESKRIREAFARSALNDVLFWAFEHEETLLDQDDADLADFFFILRSNLSHIAPPWKFLMDEWRHAPVSQFRDDFAEALAAIRAIARDVASNVHSTDPRSMRIELSLADPTRDTDGRPRWRLRGRFADALVWMACTLFAEVPRSVVRLCGLPGCERVFVGTHNQRYCTAHQAEARRQAMQHALRAFRARKRRKRR
jgi:hypothetical protein